VSDRLLHARPGSVYSLYLSRNHRPPGSGMLVGADQPAVATAGQWLFKHVRPGYGNVILSERALGNSIANILSAL